MTDDPTEALRKLVRHVGQYPEQAYHFVREGLCRAALQVHGPETEAHRRLQKYLVTHQLDWDDLAIRYHASQLPPEVVEAIHEAGGYEKLNRHVSGRELCWALRDYAIQCWGMLAREVLETWGITTTADFGRIVFGFIEFDMMQKQADDSVEDFTDVYSFDEAFRTVERDDRENRQGS
ncbi:MAG: Minf_1886 family protein [Phycisphaerae bacterium]